MFLYCRCSRTLLSRIFFYKNSSKYFVLIYSSPAAVRVVLNMSPVKGLFSCHSLYTILSDPVSGYVSTYPRYSNSLSVCHAGLSISSKEVYKHSSVKRIATGSLYINLTCWYTLSLIPLLLSSGGVRALTPPKLGGDVDTMSPDQHA